jgi:hypothetical protein
MIGKKLAMRYAFFSWLGSLPKDSEVGADPNTRYSADFGEQWAYQACQPVVETVRSVVQGQPDFSELSEPYFGEHGWHFDVSVEKQTFSIRVAWIADGNSENRFELVVTPRTGCLGLFCPRRKWHDSDFLPITELITAVLTVHPLITDFRWS